MGKSIDLNTVRRVVGGRESWLTGGANTHWLVKTWKEWGFRAWSSSEQPFDKVVRAEPGALLWIDEEPSTQSGSALLAERGSRATGCPQRLLGDLRRATRAALRCLCGQVHAAGPVLLLPNGPLPTPAPVLLLLNGHLRTSEPFLQVPNAQKRRFRTAKHRIAPVTRRDPESSPVCPSRERSWRPPPSPFTAITVPGKRPRGAAGADVGAEDVHHRPGADTPNSSRDLQAPITGIVTSPRGR